MSESLDDFDDDFEKVATLPEPIGEFLWEIKEASSRTSEKTKRIVKLVCRCVNEPHHDFEQEREYWLFKKKDKADPASERVPDDAIIRQLKEEFKLFGVDMDAYVAEGRKWKDFLPVVLKAVVGLRFKGKRSKNEAKDGGKTYVNFYLNARDKEDGAPAKLTVKDIEERAAKFDEDTKDPFGGDEGIPE